MHNPPRSYVVSAKIRGHTTEIVLWEICRDHRGDAPRSHARCAEIICEVRHSHMRYAPSIHMSDSLVPALAAAAAAAELMVASASAAVRCAEIVCEIRIDHMHDSPRSYERCAEII